MGQDGEKEETYSRFELPSQNRSLQRGLDILKAFRPGSDLMGNSEIADRTGIPKATVSRLTQTLMKAGFLDHDPRARAYRLGAVSLSLALAARMSNPVLQAALPLMRVFSERYGVNVGLAARDLDEMIYLESIRINLKSVMRRVVTGQRVPIELTSLGRAYLAVAPENLRTEFLERLRARKSARLAIIEEQIAEAIVSVAENGFCAASWQPEVVALATPIAVPEMPVYVINMSMTTPEPFDAVVERLRKPLLELRDEILKKMDDLAIELSANF